MKIPLRSNASTFGRRMAGARSLWLSNGMTREQFGKPIIAIANSFTQFVPGHVHLHDIGQKVKAVIEEQGFFAAEFNTIAIDDGIAMGSTMRACVMCLKNKKPGKIIVAAPVAGREISQKLRALVDEVVILETPPFFRAVADSYKNWYDVSDEEVMEILREWE